VDRQEGRVTLSPQVMPFPIAQVVGARR
jgi:hypothetical protein